MARTIASGELLKDRYRLERTLGRGGMAAVWLGHDDVLDRPVAVKVLADTIASDPGFVVRFRREARTAAGLSHPNLADVYDFAEEGERPYLGEQERAPLSSAQPTTTEPTVPSPQAAPDPARGVKLNEEGFALIEAGDPEAPDQESAVRAELEKARAEAGG